MKDTAQTLNYLLVDIFNQIMKIERSALVHDELEDLTISEFHTMEQIGNFANPTMSDVALKLNVTLGTLTISINRLIKKGYVNKEKSNTDKRIAHLSLTAKGMVANQKHKNFHTEMIDVILENITTQEQEVLAKTLEHLITFFTEKYKIS